MKNKNLFLFLSGVAARTAGALAVKRQIQKYLSDDKNKRMLMDKGNDLAQAVLKSLADAVSDRGVPTAEQYDNNGYLAGNDRFLTEPATDAKWSLGFSKASIVPEKVNGDLYVGGYLVFPPNKVSGFMTDQLVRSVAIDDGSGRGIHVFTVIDCIGISNVDVRIIRQRLRNLIKEKNILSLNISATHCHSGVDTQGLWGDLLAVVKKNPRAVRKGTPEKLINGKNADFMEQLYQSAVKTVEEAVQNMKSGTLSFALPDAADFSRDKRPPYVKDDVLTSLRFVPDDGSKTLHAVFFAAHPVCYGSHQTEVSSDYPYFMCREFEDNGFDAMFFQGAQAAVATDRGPHIPKGLSRDEGIAEYGRAMARFVLSKEDFVYKKIEPMLNVNVQEFVFPCDNAVLELAGKLKIVDNNMIKVPENGSFVYRIVTELGYAEFGSELRFVLIPGEMMPEILTGGAFTAKESYNGTDWEYPSMRSLVDGHLTPIGLCNDHIGYIVPDNDFGSIFAPDHYEEAVSLGGRCASGIMQAFTELLATAEELKK